RVLFRSVHLLAEISHVLRHVLVVDRSRGLIIDRGLTTLGCRQRANVLEILTLCAGKIVPARTNLVGRAQFGHGVIGVEGAHHFGVGAAIRTGIRWRAQLRKGGTRKSQSESSCCQKRFHIVFLFSVVLPLCAVFPPPAVG